MPVWIITRGTPKVRERRRPRSPTHRPCLRRQTEMPTALTAGVARHSPLQLAISCRVAGPPPHVGAGGRKRRKAWQRRMDTVQLRTLLRRILSVYPENSHGPLRKTGKSDRSVGKVLENSYLPLSKTNTIVLLATVSLRHYFPIGYCYRLAEARRARTLAIAQRHYG